MNGQHGPCKPVSFLAGCVDYSHLLCGVSPLQGEINQSWVRDADKTFDCMRLVKEEMNRRALGSLVNVLNLLTAIFSQRNVEVWAQCRLSSVILILFYSIDCR